MQWVSQGKIDVWAALGARPRRFTLRITTLTLEMDNMIHFGLPGKIQSLSKIE